MTDSRKDIILLCGYDEFECTLNDSEIREHRRGKIRNSASKEFEKLNKLYENFRDSLDLLGIIKIYHIEDKNDARLYDDFFDDISKIVEKAHFFLNEHKDFLFDNKGNNYNEFMKCAANKYIQFIR